MNPREPQQKLTGIVGHACRVAGASSPSELWELIESQKDVGRNVPAEKFNIEAFYHPSPQRQGSTNVKRGYFLNQDPSLFDASFFRTSKKEAESMDPQQRMLLEVVYEALEDAGITLDEIAGSKTSVFTGSFSLDYQRLLDLEQPASTSKYAVTGLSQSMMSSRISYFFDLHGESISLDTACSSTLTALFLANESLKQGRSDMAIVAGSALHLHPGIFVEMQQLGMLARDGRSKAYDNAADGYARGEGIVAIIMKRVTDAEAHHDVVKSVIRAVGVNHDGSTQGITMPNEAAQESLMRETYKNANISPDDTAYFEGHGTVIGDQKEVEAIKSVFHTGTRASPLYLGSIKTNIGHTEGAAGLVSVIKATLALQKAQIPSNMHFHKSNKTLHKCDGGIVIPVAMLPWPARDGRPARASINSFGYGGSNAHLVLESYDASQRGNKLTNGTSTHTNDVKATAKIIPLTAHNQAAADLAVTNLKSYIARQADLSMDAFIHTLTARRSSHRHRTFLIATDRESLVESLSQPLQWMTASAETPRIGFLFTGQGATSAGMASALLGRNAVFTETIDRCNNVLHSLPDGPSWNIAEELLKVGTDSNLVRSEYSQPITISVQLGLIEALRSWGIHPSASCGHSSGEIPAAYASGILSFETAIIFAYYRGLYTSRSRPESSPIPGAMLAVGMSESEANKALQDFKGYLTLAAVNSPTSCTISGDLQQVEQFEAMMDEKDIFALRLDVTQAYHSHHMLRFKTTYETMMQQCTLAQSPRPPTSPMFSSVTARPANWREMGPSYWTKNLVSTVRYTEALMGTVLDDFDEQQVDILLEIGPDPALKGPSRQTLAANRMELPHIPTLTRANSGPEALLKVAGTLFSLGVPLDLKQINNDHTVDFLQELPSYAWDQQKYWAPSKLAADMTLGQSRLGLAGYKLPGYTKAGGYRRTVLPVESLPTDAKSNAPILTAGTAITIILDSMVDHFRDAPLVDLVSVDLTNLPYLVPSEDHVELCTQFMRLSSEKEPLQVYKVRVHTTDGLGESVELLSSTVEVNHSQRFVSGLPNGNDVHTGVNGEDARASLPHIGMKRMTVDGPRSFAWNSATDPSDNTTALGSLVEQMVASTLEHLIVPDEAWTVGASKLQSIERLSFYPESILASDTPRVHGVLDVKEVLALPTRLQMSAVVRADDNSGLVASYSRLHMCREVEESTTQEVQKNGIQPKTPQTQNGSKLAQSLASCQDEKEQSDAVLSALMARLSKLTGIPSANIHPATQLASCGLDSLMAADIRNWCLKTVGVTLTVAQVIKSESLRALVATIVQRLPSTASTTKTMDSSTYNNGAESNEIPRVAESGKYPLSSFQSRLWFTQMLVEDTKMFNCRLLFMLDGNVHEPAMKAAWEALALSNASFRTAFIDGEAYTEQTIVPMTDVDLPFHDLSSSTNASEELERLSRSIQAKDLDLMRGEVIRLALVRLREGKYCVVFIVHHLVFDRGSCPRLLEQLTAFYDNIRRQQPLDLSRWKQTQYIDYVSWQSQQTSATSIKAHLDYWKQSLSGVAAEAPLLPFAKQQRGLSEGIHTSVHRTILDVRLLRRMKRVCSTLGLTPFHFILASFMAFFHRYTGVTDQVVLAVDGSRPHPDVADIIGLFVNMLPIRLVSDYDGTMCDIFKATKLAALGGSEHPVPFDEIVRAVGVKTEPGVFPLGQVALNYQVHGTMPNVKTDDFSVARLITEDVPTACDMSLEAIEDPQNGLRLALEHSTVLYDRVDMERFLQNFVCFTESIVKDHFQPVKEVPMSGEMEMKLIKSFWAENEPWRLDHSPNPSISEIIRHAAAAHPEKVACIDNMGTRLTYKQLIDAADGTAASLKQRGIQPGDHVGLYCDPGTHEIIGILGIVFARCAYVALDPKFASERLDYMARDSGARVILTGHEPPTTMFDGLELLPISEASKCTAIFQQEPSKLTDPLYVTYTSGSTGRPKGTIMSHSNALPMLLAIQEQFGFTAADNFLHQITMAFDLSVVQIFSPLLVGATMSIATAEARQDAFLLASFMRNAGVTFTYFTPTQFALVLEAEPEVLRACRKWKTAWFCGEAFPGKLARSWHDHHLPAALYNTYGPCEAMVQATIYSVPLTTSGTGVVPIGSPLPTVQSYILDAALNPLPIGVEGDLYLGGPQVGSAYLNNPEATRRSFVDDPFVESKFHDEELLSGKKMFKTGDVCRLDKKNTLHFVGRVAGDRMIKLRGLRIDTSEIEEQIQATTLAKISRVCVIARDSRPAKASAEAPGLMDERVLFAFVVFAGHPPADTVQFVQQLTESLRKNLNEYMLPVGYIVLDQMPMTGSGKIDRLNMRDRDLAGSVFSTAGRAPAATPAALPVPRPSVDAAPPPAIPQEVPVASGASLNGQASVASQDNHPPAIANGQSSDAARETAFSFVVSGIQEILSVPAGLEIVGSTSFFELGGSSLTLMRLHGKIKRQYGAIVSLKKLFASPTVDGIVALLAPAPITNGSRPEIHPTSVPSALNEPALARKIDASPTAKQWDWNQETSLPDNANFNVPTSNDTSLFTLSDPTDIFLTGVDTFHGLHVLAEIMNHSDDIIHLVGTEQPTTKESLMASFRDFDLFRGQITPARLLQQTRVHRGDMTQKHFGFSQQDFFMLGSRVHTIYSLGVSVSLLKTYSDLRDIDVGRMKDLVELAAMGTKPSAIVHLSTFSVPQIQSWHQVQRHDRHRVIKTPVSARSYVPSTDDDNGYAKVRWVGERVLEEAASRGFPVTILRGSAMTRSIATRVAEPRCGIVQQGIMGMLLSGTVPDVPGYVADFVPIDHLAKWIYALAEQPYATTITEARFYHVTNPSPLPIDDIRGIDSGTTKTVPLKEWFELMEQSTAHGSGDLVRWAGIRAFFETGHVYWGLDTASTERVLADLGITMRECPPVTMDFLTELWGDWPNRDA